MNYKTECKNCIFATKPGECQLERLDPFQKNGATIEHDENGNVTIKGRYCSALRTNKWAEKKDRFNLPIIVRAELLISTETIIYINDENYQEDKLKKTLDSIEKQLLKTNLVVFNNNSSLSVAKLIKIAKEYNFSYRVDKVMLGENKERVHELDSLDFSLVKGNADFYVILYPGGTLDDDEFYANIDESLNERMLRFSYILPNEEIGRGPFVSYALHKKLQGNIPMSEARILEEGNGSKEVVFNTLKEKVDYLAKKDGHEYLIKKYEDIKNG
jgi:hypothetical protein